MKPAAAGTLVLLLGLLAAGLATAAERAADAEIRALIDQLYDVDFERREEADRLLSAKLDRSHVPLLREGEAKYADVPEVKDRIFRHRRRADLGFDPEHRAWLSDVQVLAAVPESMRARVEEVLKDRYKAVALSDWPTPAGEDASSDAMAAFRDALASASALRQAKEAVVRNAIRQYLERVNAWTPAQMEEDLYDAGMFETMSGSQTNTHVNALETLKSLLRWPDDAPVNAILRRYLEYGADGDVLCRLMQDAGERKLATETQLVDWTRSPSREISGAAWHALHEMRSPFALRRHKDELKDAEASKRWLAVIRILEFNDPSSWDDLVPMLKDPSEVVASCAMQACARICPEKTLPYLDAGLSDERVGFRKSAALAVMCFLPNHAFETRVLAASLVLSRVNTGVLEQLVLPRLRGLPAKQLAPLALEVVQCCTAENELHIWYGLAIESAAPAQCRKVFRAVFDTAPEPERRAAALAALGKLMEAEDRQCVRMGLDDASLTVRGVAAKILGERGTDEDLPVLRSALAKEVTKAKQNPEAWDACAAIRTAIMCIANKSILDRPVNVPADDGPGEE